VFVLQAIAISRVKVQVLRY